MTDVKIPPTLGLMLDCETLSLDARALVTQIALYPFDFETEELILDALHIYLPIQPQLDLIPSRKISADTFVWWMQQNDEARKAFEKNVGDDFEELPILMRQFIRRFEKLTANRDYELICRGPQADEVWVRTLLEDCGYRAPWEYRKVTDLRTLMRYAGLSSKDIPEPVGFIPHRADWDCKYQIQQYFEMKRKLRS